MSPAIHPSPPRQTTSGPSREEQLRALRDRLMTMIVRNEIRRRFRLATA